MSASLSENWPFLVDRGIVGPGDQPSQLKMVLLRDCQRLKEVSLETGIFAYWLMEVSKIVLDGKDG